MEDLIPVGGVGAVAVAVVTLIVHILRQASADRISYQARLMEQRAQYTDELAAVHARYDEQIADLRQQIDTLRAEVADLRQQLEHERRARWQAEDQAAKWRREAGLEPG